MTATADPVCTGGCVEGHPRDIAFTYAHLPCGCQDAHFDDGTVCYEHAHVDCDGTPEETR